MRFINRAVALTVLSLTFGSSLIVAQDRRDDHGQGRQDDHRQGGQNDQRQGGQADHRQDAPDNHRYVRHDDWKKGRRMNQNDWGRGERIDYRNYHLNAPRRGYEWRQVDGNYVLAAVATGLIASVIAASATR